MYSASWCSSADLPVRRLPPSGCPLSSRLHPLTRSLPLALEDVPWVPMVGIERQIHILKRNGFSESFHWTLEVMTITACKSPLYPV